MLRRLISAYVHVLRSLHWVPPLAARLYFGYAIFVAGKDKLFGDIAPLVSLLESKGFFLPTFQAHLAATTELVGGLLLIVGLGTRIVALPLAFTMVVAVMTAHAANISDFESFLAESPGPFLVAFVYLLLAGPGKASIDHLIALESETARK